MGVAVLIELGAIRAFWKAKIILKNESSSDNQFLGKSISNYSLKAPKETDGGVHIIMIIIYLHNSVGNHNCVRNQ